MRRLVIPLTLLLLVAGALGPAESTQRAQKGDLFTNPGKPPTGRLGRPIGSYLTIEGHRNGKGMNPDSYVIDTVNGVKLEKSVRHIWIENLKLPRPKPAIRCVINGYETFR